MSKELSKSPRTLKAAVISCLEPGLTTSQLRDYVLQKCRERDYDPIDELIKLARNGDISGRDRVKIHSEMVQYLVPKLRSMDVKADVNMDINVNIVRFSDEEEKAPIDVEVVEDK